MHRHFLLWFLIFAGLLVGYTALYYGRLSSPVHAIAVTKRGDPINSTDYHFVPRYKLSCDKEHGFGQCQMDVQGETVVIYYQFDPPNSPMGSCQATYNGQMVACEMEQVNYPWRHFIVLRNFDAGIPQWRTNIESFFAEMGLGIELYWMLFLVVVSVVVGVVAGIELMQRGQEAGRKWIRSLKPLFGLFGAVSVAFLCGYSLFAFLFLTGIMLD